VEVLRVLPFRQHVRKDGRLDASAAMQAAVNRLDLFERIRSGGAEAQIEELQADANYFWWPTDTQLETLGTAVFGRSASQTELVELRAAVCRPGAGQ
jgi:hypothetical protein